MQQLKRVKTDEADRILTRVLGREVVILSRQETAINRWIAASLLELEPTAVADTESHGRMLLLPIDEEQQAIHLFYFFAPQEGSERRMIQLRLHPEFFRQWAEDLRATEPLFRFDQTTEQQFSIDPQLLLLLDALFATPASVSPLAAALLRTETAFHLLRRTIEAITVPFNPCAVPACRFLALDAEREKILAARDLLLAGTERPLTIKELARKVAMNECYLKKGFKALTGKTVHEFQHERRMARAVELLRSGSSTVSDVAIELGFLSISHFSTAFKKATGIKACELLK
ncbi:MAG: AraC family transcriptional regulator [Sphingobacteriales bacterium]|nr:MAG: AraC family transcriptional regulator [Sphingobacteriales bacterium]